MAQDVAAYVAKFRGLEEYEKLDLADNLGKDSFDTMAMNSYKFAKDDLDRLRGLVASWKKTQKQQSTLALSSNASHVTSKMYKTVTEAALGKSIDYRVNDAYNQVIGAAKDNVFGDFSWGDGPESAQKQKYLNQFQATLKEYGLKNGQFTVLNADCKEIGNKKDKEVLFCMSDAEASTAYGGDVGGHWVPDVVICYGDIASIIGSSPQEAASKVAPYIVAIIDAKANHLNQTQGKIQVAALGRVVNIDYNNKSVPMAFHTTMAAKDNKSSTKAFFFMDKQAYLGKNVKYELSVMPFTNDAMMKCIKYSILKQLFDQGDGDDSKDDNDNNNDNGNDVEMKVNKDSNPFIKFKQELAQDEPHLFSVICSMASYKKNDIVKAKG